MCIAKPDTELPQSSQGKRMLFSDRWSVHREDMCLRRATQERTHVTKFDIQWGSKHLQAYEQPEGMIHNGTLTLQRERQLDMS